MNNFKVIRNGNPNNMVKVDKELHDKCIFDSTLSLKSKGMFMMMLLDPQKLYTEYDFMSPLDKFDSVTSGLKDLLDHEYIEKFNKGYVVKGLFKGKNFSQNSGYVYIISDNYENYKIGLTNNVAKRLEEFKTAMPYDVNVINILHCDDMYKTEKSLHRKFKDKRLNGEWFKLNKTDIEFIKSLSGDYYE